MTSAGAAARLGALSDQLEALMADVAPATVSGPEASRLVVLFERMERLACSGKTGMAQRAVAAEVHRRTGHRTPAEWLASATGASVHDAKGTLELGRRLEQQPAVDEAFRAGRLSKGGAQLIAGAVAADPTSEERLLRAAEGATFRQLGEECERVRAAARSADAAAKRYARQHRSRHFKYWTDGTTGSFCFRGSLTPDAGARLMTSLRSAADRAARAAKEREPYEAHLADALVSLGGAGHGQPSMHIRVDLEALRRGSPGPGEVCEIPGVGAVPVERARELLGEALTHVIVTDGVDVTTVCRLDRYIPPELRQALIERDRTCVVPDCDARAPLEIDHWRVDFADGGPTQLDNLARLCRPHHRLKSLGLFQLEGGPGRWRYVPRRE